MSTKSEAVVGKKKELSSDNFANSPLPLAEFYEGEQPVVRSLFKAFVENVSDVTFGNPIIAKFIQEGSLSVSDGVLRVSPSIQNDEAFSWWITTLISFTARTMLSIEGLCAQDRTAIYSNLCKLSPYLSRKGSDSSVKQKSTSCGKCRSGRRTNSSGSPSAKESSSLKTKKKCSGTQCPRRKKMQCEFEAQARILQNYWRLIRQSIQRLMRGDSAVSSDFKQVNREGRMVALTMGISALCKLDPHQLFKRLECVSTEHVMRLKISLWDILVTPNKVTCLKKYYDMKPPANALAIAQAKFFIKALLDEFSKFQDAVKEVSHYLVPLDEEYLKQFGVTWKVVNHHIFDKVIYQDELFKSFVPHMETALQVQLTSDGSTKFPTSSINAEYEKHFPELFSGLPELVKSFQLFHRLMLTSREMFRRADLLMQTFVKQQQFLHSRAKVEILEKDLDFFTQQRRMVRKFVCEPKKLNAEGGIELQNSTSNPEESVSETSKREMDEEADEAEFVRRFRVLLDYGPNSTGRCKSLSENKRETVCKYCNHTHCWCDECSFYHMILCGLIDCGIDSMESDFSDLRNIFSLDGNLDNESDAQDNTKKPRLIEELTKRSKIDCSAKNKCEQQSTDKSSIASGTKKDNPDSAADVNSSLFTLHETAEFCKQIVDSQSTWDVGTFDCYAACKCEQEESDDENCNCSKSYSSSFSIKNMSKRQFDYHQRLNSRITPKKSSLQKHAKSTTSGMTTTTTTTTDHRQCFISEDKKSVVHLNKKGICVTQITKATSRGMFLSKNAKDADDSCSDVTEESSDENDDIKVDIQRISENIVREIEKSLTNNTSDMGAENGAEKNSTDSASYSKDCFSSFFGSGCRKLIESLMKKTVDGGNNTRSTVLEEDTDESLSVDSSVGRCSHGHDHHESCQGEDQRERFSRCDCCYCTYMANDMPSRHDGRRNEEIRQRLRKVLKQREERTINRSHNSVSSDTRSCRETEKEPSKETVENRTVDELLQFINEKTPAEGSPSTKAAKKARQKQRKMDEKMKKAESERLRKEKEAKALEEKIQLQKEEDAKREAASAKKLEMERLQKAEAKAKEKQRKKNENIPSTDNKKADSGETVKLKDKKPDAVSTQKTTAASVNNLSRGKQTVESKAVEKDTKNGSPFATPTKLAKAFEDQNGAQKATAPTSANRNGSAADAPKISFKSQAALASKAAHDNMKSERFEPTLKDDKRDSGQKERSIVGNGNRSSEKAALRTADHRGTNGIPANNNAKENLQQKQTTQAWLNNNNYDNVRQTTVCKSLQTPPKTVDTKNASFAQSVARGIKAKQPQQNFEIHQQLQQKKKGDNELKAPIAQQLIGGVGGTELSSKPKRVLESSVGENVVKSPLTSVSPAANKKVGENEKNASNFVTTDEEIKYLRQRAAAIAAAAAAAGTPLPPLSSLTPDQQQKYFTWIKQIQPNSIPQEPVSNYISQTGAKERVPSENLSMIDFQHLQNQQKQELADSLRAVDYDQPQFNKTSAVGAIGSGRPVKAANFDQQNAQPKAPLDLQQLQHVIGNDGQTAVTFFDSLANSQESPAKRIPTMPLSTSVGVVTASLPNRPAEGETVQQPLSQTSVPRYGVIGEKPVQRKTFNQYAAYDRETNHILGLSHSPLGSIAPPPLTQSLSPAALLGGGSGLAVDTANSGYMNVSTTAASFPFQNHFQQPRSATDVASNVAGGAIGFGQPNERILGAHQFFPQNNFLPLQTAASIGQEYACPHANKKTDVNASSSIWQNDDDAKRFVESEECAVFKFS